MIEGRGGVTFIDGNNNRLYIRMSYFGCEDLVGFTRYASQDEYGSASFRVPRYVAGLSGGEDVVFRIGLSIASIVTGKPTKSSQPK